MDSINFNNLRKIINAGTMVPVADCTRNYQNSHVKLKMEFGEFLQHWQKNGQPDDPDDDERILYLKDWHLRNERPEYGFYQTPAYFGSDWLNEHLTTTAADRDDYRFVYMGPKGTW